MKGDVEYEFCTICGNPTTGILPGGACGGCLEPISIFWRRVCERVARDGYYNEITRGIMHNHESAARTIIAEMRSDAE